MTKDYFVMWTINGVNKPFYALVHDLKADEVPACVGTHIVWDITDNPFVDADYLSRRIEAEWKVSGNFNLCVYWVRLQLGEPCLVVQNGVTHSIAESNEREMLNGKPDATNF